MKLEVGKYYRRRDGKIVGPVEYKGNSTTYPFEVNGYIYTETGRFDVTCHASKLDLINEVIVEDVIPKGYVQYYNIYPSYVGGGFKNRADADRLSGRDRIGCKRVVFTEGEWDE